jgi:FkbM family methyltransferase
MVTRFLFWLYSLVEASGFLQSGPGRRLFAFAYFTYKRFWEDSFAALIRLHPELFRGGDVLDAGANIGYTAWQFVRAIDAGRAVHAFEPELQNLAALQRVAARDTGNRKIVPVHAAVGATAGVISLCVNTKHPGDHRVLTDNFDETSRGMPRLEVPMVSLDDYVSALRPVPPIAFVKIDVQGFELAVCQGLEKVLAANPKLTIALEYMPEAMTDLGFSAEELLKWLRDRDFFLYLLRFDGVLTPVSGSVPVGKRGYEDIVCRRTAIS